MEYLKMNLYHFTNADIDILKTEFFGQNYYTKNDSQYSLPRLFFYDSPIPKEYYLKGSKYCYTVNIPKNRIYNLDIDNLNIKEKFQYDIDGILEYISKNYIGCCYSTSFLCYCIFQNVMPIARHEYINREYIKI